jgi:hypothetical protein
MDDDNTGVDITQGAAGAAHIASLNYPIVWGNVTAGVGLSKVVAGDVMTLNVDAGHPPVQDSIEYTGAGVDTLHLVGDSAAPPDFSCYGKGVGGKGWSTIEELCDNSFSIATVAPGAGLGTQFDVIYTAASSVEITANGCQFIGDEAAPADFSVYGKGVGAKGWNTLDQLLQNSDSIAVVPPAGAAATSFDVILTAASSIEETGNGIQLESDSAAPGNDKFYGTDDGGTKGWQGFAEIEVVTDVRLNADGTFDKKTRTIHVAQYTAESAWTSAGSLDTTVCP